MRRVFWSLTALLGVVGLFLSVPAPSEASEAGPFAATTSTTPGTTCPTVTVTHSATRAASTTCQTTTTTVNAPATMVTCPPATVTMTPTFAAVPTCEPSWTTTVWAQAVTSTTTATTPVPSSTDSPEKVFTVAGAEVWLSWSALAVVGIWLSSRR